MKIRRGWLIVQVVAAWAGVWVASAVAQEAATPEIQARRLPASVSLGFERTKVADGERMGLLGASYVLEWSPGWWAGPALYGAATGQRGGLFAWGAEAQRRWRVSERWEAITGVYVGGGGGGGAPVGGGLMLRPHAEMMFDWGGWATGIGVSQVRFPSGSIRGTQLDVVLAMQDEFAFTVPAQRGQRVSFAGPGGLGTSAIQLTSGRYNTATSTRSPLTYVGVRMEWEVDPVWSATFAANGAASGGADGYAEATAGVLALWPIGGDDVRLGAHVVAGLGGGGAVPTGGGPIAKVALAGRLRLNPALTLDAEVGRTRAFSGGLDTNHVELLLGMALGDRPVRPDTAGLPVPVHDSEWALSVQDYLGAQRKDGSTRSLSTLGLKFRRALGEHLYLSGQAHSAVTGGAGAYSAGLVGMGLETRLAEAQAWRVGAEALVGAGGGGGVSSRGGAIAQPMVWAGRDLGRFSRIRLGAGVVKSLRGELSSAVVELAWGVEFGLP